MASQHGLNSLATDVAAVKACLARVTSPVVLVGHSYGGTLITHAGTDPRVAALVYIAALAPDADKRRRVEQGKFPTTDVFAHIEVTDGRIWLKQSGISCFCGDLPETEQSSSMQRKACRYPIFSIRSTMALRGRRSRAGTSWAPRIIPSILIWNDSQRSAWAPPRWSCAAVTSRCCPSLMPCST